MTTERAKLLETSGHILVLGGPGSGKTTIALKKATQEIQSGVLKSRQRILFLSFARATIARVVQMAGRLTSSTDKQCLQIDTYHGFAWSLLRSHGYLLNRARSIRLLPPPEAASHLAGMAPSERLRERERLFEEEGLLHFDLFAAKVSELLANSKALARIVTDTYPLIILDEFQDTNSDEWSMIKELGRQSRLIALADADQRIYEFRGADPRRIGEFILEFKPTQFDFGVENNRSGATDIVAFGNDLLVGANLTNTYKDVIVSRYEPRKAIAIHGDLKVRVLATIKGLRKTHNSDWSLAILVPTRQLMLEVSTYLDTVQRFSNGRSLTDISHEVAFDASGPSLAAIAIGGLLNGGTSPETIGRNLMTDLYSYIRGRNDATTQADLQLAAAISSYLTSGIVRGARRRETIGECLRFGTECYFLRFTGDPGEDWLSIRNLLAGSSSQTIRDLAENAKYLRLLHKGALFRSRLSELWRKNGTYAGATSLVRDALTQEHFSASTKEYKGVQVMTIHKSKGKEFDQVIIYEGTYQNRIVPMNPSPERLSQSRLMLRVGVTRAKEKVMIYTPRINPCVLLCRVPSNSIRSGHQ